MNRAIFRHLIISSIFLIVVTFPLLSKVQKPYVVGGLLLAEESSSLQQIGDTTFLDARLAWTSEGIYVLAKGSDHGLTLFRLDPQKKQVTDSHPLPISSGNDFEFLVFHQKAYLIFSDPVLPETQIAVINLNSFLVEKQLVLNTTWSLFDIRLLQETLVLVGKESESQKLQFSLIQIPALTVLQEGITASPSSVEDFSLAASDDQIYLSYRDQGQKLFLQSYSNEIGFSSPLLIRERVSSAPLMSMHGKNPVLVFLSEPGESKELHLIELPENNIALGREMAIPYFEARPFFLTIDPLKSYLTLFSFDDRLHQVLISQGGLVPLRFLNHRYLDEKHAQDTRVQESPDRQTLVLASTNGLRFFTQQKVLQILSMGLMNDVLSITFDESYDPGSLTSETLSIQSPITGPFSCVSLKGDASRQYQCRLNRPLSPDEPFTATVTSEVRNREGHSLLPPISFHRPLPSSLLRSQGSQKTAVADLDHDGIVEKVVLEGNKLHLIQGPAGGFKNRTIDLHSFGSDMALSDWDRNGDIDIFVTMPEEDKILMLLNENHGSSFTSSFLEGVSHPETLAFQDINGDVNADLLIFQPSVSSLRMIVNHRPYDIPLPQETVSILIDDLDQDGDLDLEAQGPFGKIPIRNSGFGLFPALF